MGNKGSAKVLWDKSIAMWQIWYSLVKKCQSKGVKFDFKKMFAHAGYLIAAKSGFWIEHFSLKAGRDRFT